MKSTLKESCSYSLKWLSPISFVKGLLKNERCPHPPSAFFFFFFSQGRMSSCCLAGCLDDEEEEEEGEEPDAFIRYITSLLTNPLLPDTSSQSRSVSPSLKRGNWLSMTQGRILLGERGHAGGSQGQVMSGTNVLVNPALSCHVFNDPPHIRREKKIFSCWVRVM